MGPIESWVASVAGDFEIVYLVITGSRATGTGDESSDYDIGAVYLPPLGDCLAGFDRAGPAEFSAEEDGVSYDLVLQPLHKFVKLCWQANPNILDWLFVPEECRLHMPDKFRLVMHRRGIFLSNQLYWRFRGYAMSHREKMERGVTRHLGEKRKADIQEFGYSCKNAMCLIRLLRVGCEVLETGEYNVRRPDAAELLEIRQGKWQLDQVKAEADKLLTRLQQAHGETQLGPPAPREDIMEMVLSFWGL